MRLIPSLVTGLLVATAGVASADAPRFARPCAKGNRELPAAEARLEQLGQAITQAAPDAPSAPLVKELNALLATPCFELATNISDVDTRTATTLALQRWWKDGGYEWLAAHLAGSSQMTFPPTMRETLSLEHAPKHRLARLLCRAADRTCGGETAGWVARAEEAFRTRALQEARWRGEGYTENLYARTTPPKEGPDESVRQQSLDIPLWNCAHPKGKRTFEAWAECVGALRRPVALFPVGAVRAPTRGWLVVRGRRGHYQFCDGLTAFDLATGAYYASTSCSRLALRTDGSVNAQQTDAARSPAVEAGRVSVDNLREAAWMMFLAGELEEDGYENADSFPIPPKLEIKVELDGHGTGGASSWASSAQTQLAWTWIDGGAIVAEGTLTWPDSYRAGENHAAELLRVAEAGKVPGCPSAPVPTQILKGCGKGGVSPIDSSAASLCKVQAELAQRLASFTCTKSTR